MSKIKPLKFVSAILIATFLVQDIVWAYPDICNTPHQNNKLATSSIFKDAERRPPAQYGGIIVVSDFHGVLTKPNWRQKWAFVYERLAARQGLNVTPEDIESWVNTSVVGHPDNVIVGLLTEKFCLSEDVVESIVRESTDRIKTEAAEDAVKIVKKLVSDESVDFFIVSGADQRKLTRQIREAGFGGLVPDNKIIGGMSEAARADFLIGLKKRNPGCAIVYLDDWDWLQTITMLKDSGVLIIGMPQGEGPEQDKNAEILRRAGAHLVFRHGLGEVDALLSNRAGLNLALQKMGIAPVVPSVGSTISPPPDDMRKNMLELRDALKEEVESPLFYIRDELRPIMDDEVRAWEAIAAHIQGMSPDDRSGVINECDEVLRAGDLMAYEQKWLKVLEIVCRCHAKNNEWLEAIELLHHFIGSKKFDKGHEALDLLLTMKSGREQPPQDAYYLILGLGGDAGRRDIHKALTEKLKRRDVFDKDAPPKDPRRLNFYRLIEAREVLLDSARREQYKDGALHPSHLFEGWDPHAMTGVDLRIVPVDDPAAGTLGSPISPSPNATRAGNEALAGRLAEEAGLAKRPLAERITLYRFASNIDGTGEFVKDAAAHVLGSTVNIENDRFAMAELEEGESLSIKDLGVSTCFVMRGRKPDGKYTYIMARTLRVYDDREKFIYYLADIMAEEKFEAIEAYVVGPSRTDFTKSLANLQLAARKTVTDKGRYILGFWNNANVRIDAAGFCLEHQNIMAKEPESISREWNGAAHKAETTAPQRRGFLSRIFGRKTHASDGLISQGEEAFRQMVANLKAGRSSDARSDERIAEDIKAVDVAKDPAMRILFTDEVVNSDNDFAFGFYSHAPPVMERIISILGSKAAFDLLFPMPTLVLTRAIMSNTHPSVRREYIHHELRCGALGHYEAIFEQQAKFPENYASGDYEEDGARKYIKGFKGNSEKPFKGLLGRVIAQRLKYREVKPAENFKVYHVAPKGDGQPNFVILEDTSYIGKKYSLKELYGWLANKMGVEGKEGPTPILYDESRNAIYLRLDATLDQLLELFASTKNHLNNFFLAADATGEEMEIVTIDEPSAPTAQPSVPQPLRHSPAKSNIPVTEADIGRFCNNVALMARGAPLNTEWTRTKFKEIIAAKDVLLSEHRDWCRRLQIAIKTRGNGVAGTRDLLADIRSSLAFVETVPLTEPAAAKAPKKEERLPAQGAVTETPEVVAGKRVLRSIIDRGRYIERSDMDAIRPAIPFLTKDDIETLKSIIERTLRSSNPDSGFRTSLIRLETDLDAVKRGAHQGVSVQSLSPAPGPARDKQVKNEETVQEFLRSMEAAHSLNRTGRTRLLNLDLASLSLDELRSVLRVVEKFMSREQPGVTTYEKAQWGPLDIRSQNARQTAELRALLDRVTIAIEAKKAASERIAIEPAGEQPRIPGLPAHRIEGLHRRVEVMRAAQPTVKAEEERRRHLVAAVESTSVKDSRELANSFEKLRQYPVFVAAAADTGIKVEAFIDIAVDTFIKEAIAAAGREGIEPNISVADMARFYKGLEIVQEDLNRVFGIKIDIPYFAFSKIEEDDPAAWYGMEADHTARFIITYAVPDISKAIAMSAGCAVGYAMLFDEYGIRNTDGGAFDMVMYERLYRERSAGRYFENRDFERTPAGETAPDNVFSHRYIGRYTAQIVLDRIGYELYGNQALIDSCESDRNNTERVMECMKEAGAIPAKYIDDFTDILLCLAHNQAEREIAGLETDTIRNSVAKFLSESPRHFNAYLAFVNELRSIFWNTHLRNQAVVETESLGVLSAKTEVRGGEEKILAILRCATIPMQLAFIVEESGVERAEAITIVEKLKSEKRITDSRNDYHYLSLRSEEIGNASYPFEKIAASICSRDNLSEENRDVLRRELYKLICEGCRFLGDTPNCYTFLEVAGSWKRPSTADEGQWSSMKELAEKLAGAKGMADEKNSAIWSTLGRSKRYEDCDLAIDEILEGICACYEYAKTLKNLAGRVGTSIEVEKLGFADEGYLRQLGMDPAERIMSARDKALQYAENYIYLVGPLVEAFRAPSAAGHIRQATQEEVGAGGPNATTQQPDRDALRRRMRDVARQVAPEAGTGLASEKGTGASSSSQTVQGADIIKAFAESIMPSIAQITELSKRLSAYCNSEKPDGEELKQVVSGMRAAIEAIMGKFDVFRNEPLNGLTKQQKYRLLDAIGQPLMNIRSNLSLIEAADRDGEDLRENYDGFTNALDELQSTTEMLSRITWLPEDADNHREFIKLACAPAAAPAEAAKDVLEYDRLELATAIMRHGGPFDMQGAYTHFGSMGSFWAGKYERSKKSIEEMHLKYIELFDGFRSIGDRIKKELYDNARDYGRDEKAVIDGLKNEYIVSLDAIRELTEEYVKCVEDIIAGKDISEEFRGELEFGYRMILNLKTLIAFLSSDMTETAGPISVGEFLNTRKWKSKGRVRNLTSNVVICNMPLNGRGAAIRANPDLLFLALERAVSNGFHAGKEAMDEGREPGDIEISHYQEGGMAHIVIRNPGKIKEALLKHDDVSGIQSIFILKHDREIFDKNVGLPFMHYAIKVMGGEVEARNVKEDGAELVEFDISFPAAAGARAQKTVNIYNDLFRPHSTHGFQTFMKALLRGAEGHCKVFAANKNPKKPDRAMDITEGIIALSACGIEREDPVEVTLEIDIPDEGLARRMVGLICDVLRSDDFLFKVHVGGFISWDDPDWDERDYGRRLVEIKRDLAERVKPAQEAEEPAKAQEAPASAAGTGTGASSGSQTVQGDTGSEAANVSKPDADARKNKTLDAIHTRLAEGLKTAPIQAGQQVVLSENLFIGPDGDRAELDAIRLALAPILNDEKGFLQITDAEAVKKGAINGRDSRKDSVAVVMTRKDYENDVLWSDCDKERSIKSTILILDDAMTGQNYLYLEGVIGLARALMQKDKGAVKFYYAMLSGSELGDDVLQKLDDADIVSNAINNIAFAIMAILKFRPIEGIDPKEFDAKRIGMETFLISA